MDVIGLVAEARNTAQSIARRIENYRLGQSAFNSVQGHLAYLSAEIGEVDRLLRNFPGTLPEEIYVLFNGTLECVRSSLMSLEETVDNDIQKRLRLEIAVSWNI